MSRDQRLWSRGEKKHLRIRIPASTSVPEIQAWLVMLQNSCTKMGTLSAAASCDMER